MKKRLVLLCMAGIAAFSMGACGGKKTDADRGTSEVSDVTDASEEGTGPSQSAGTDRTGDRVSDRDDYVGIRDLDIDEYITLADYKNMTVTAAGPAVDEGSIENYINSVLLVGNITNRSVEKGDVVNIDYVGRADGEEFQGGSAEGYRLGIGSNAFIPGFEEGLVGVMPGETVDLNLTFPENYPGADMAGREVVFTVTVNGIEASAEYADVTVEEMEDMGLAYRTKEELWEAGKKAVEDNAAEVLAANSKNAIMQKLLEDSTAKSIPDYLVEEEVQNNNFYMESLANSVYGMDLETFVTQAGGMTMEEYNAQLDEMCSGTIKQYLVMEAVARAEGIEVTEDMINKKASEEAEEYGYDSAQALIDEAGYTTYRMYIVQEKVLDRLMEIVTVEEEEDRAGTE